jgi:hypothetical protein
MNSKNKTYNDILNTLNTLIMTRHEMKLNYKRSNNDIDLHSKVHLSWYNNLIDLLTDILVVHYDK